MVDSTKKFKKINMSGDLYNLDTIKAEVLKIIKLNLIIIQYF